MEEDSDDEEDDVSSEDDEMIDLEDINKKVESLV